MDKKLIRCKITNKILNGIIILCHKLSIIKDDILVSFIENNLTEYHLFVGYTYILNDKYKNNLFDPELCTNKNNLSKPREIYNHYYNAYIKNILEYN